MISNRSRVPGRLRKIIPWLVVAIYDLLASLVIGWGYFAPQAGGDAWYFMGWIYWPVSVPVDRFVAELADRASYAIASVASVFACFVLGSLWYYLLARLTVLVFVLFRRQGRDDK